MTKHQTYQLTQGQREHSQDRVAVLEHKGGTVLIVADGAGGTVRGEEAAQAIIEASIIKLASAATLPGAADWCEFLLQLDTKLTQLGGQSTVVIASVSSTGIEGASIGDSIAWLVGENSYQDLTEHQARKPLLGSGVASPTTFFCGETHGTLLLASDGLWRYVPTKKLCEVVKENDLGVAAKQLLELVRLPSGALQDDFSVLLWRSIH